MKVWLVNPFDNLPPEGYRPQRYWMMARAFAAAGHETTLFTADFNHTTKMQRVAAAGQRLVGDGFELALLPTPPYPRNVSFARIRSHRAFAAALREEFLRRLRGRTAADAPALVVVSLPPIGTAAVAFGLRRACGAKVVIDVQDDWPGTFVRLFPFGFRWLGRVLLAPLRHLVSRAYRRADWVTGVCDRYAELVRRAGAKEYRRFYLGIALNRAYPVRAWEPIGRFSILYLGNLGRTYDLKSVIKAVGRDDRLTLAIAGTGEQEAALRDYVEDTGLSDRIVFYGYLEERRLRWLASHCRFGVVPMKDDSCVGVPNKFADYAASGLYILSSLRGESAALLKKYDCGGLYDPDDPDSLIAAIEESAAKSPRFEALLDEFDAEKIYREYASSAAAHDSRSRCRTANPARWGIAPGKLVVDSW